MTAREFYNAAISSLRRCLNEENINQQGEVSRAVTEFARAVHDDGFDDEGVSAQGPPRGDGQW